MQKNFIPLDSVVNQTTTITTLVLVISLFVSYQFINWWQGKRLSFREVIHVVPLILISVGVFLFWTVPWVALNHFFDFFKSKNQKRLEKANTELNRISNKICVMSPADYEQIREEVDCVYQSILDLSDTANWMWLSKSEQYFYYRIHRRGDKLVEEAFRHAHPPRSEKHTTVADSAPTDISQQTVSV